MRKILALAFLLAFPASALAVDNTLLVTPCASGCITTKSKDIGAGVQAPQPIISDTTGAPIYGTAGTANANVLTVQGIASMTPILVTATLNAETTKVIGTVNQGTSPWVVNTTQWASGTLGAMANYGANPGSVLVPGVNAATAPSAYLTTLSAWSSGTAGNATQSLMSSGGWPAITVQLNQTSTISGGAVTFEGTYDGTNWVSIPVAQILNPNTLANLTNPYTLVQSTNQPFLILTQGYQQARVKLSTTITGSGTVTPFVALLPFNPTIAGLLNPIVWPTTVPPVKIDQTTFGTTNGVVSAANTYQAVAASQTATVLQTSTGAIGDYLSHCIIYPTSTSPGVVTVFDNTNTAATSAILFPGGATSTSNLTPITVPVGAKSTAGAWKVTTGAAVSVVCVGKFS